ncbi:formyltransferase family protein [uncultured Kordia sp.]|uniref:formyltransferase family protein n=1 Tax=uncultured Kordia sp. TaxID=507699 RepID=UPI00261A08F5|nr:formyltransferase family protein [uncultured Kordia sp.]
MQKKVALISPNPASLYSTSVSELLMRNDVKIEVVFVKKFTLSRFKDEFSRDGVRLLKKIWKKLVLKNKAYDAFANIETIVDYRKKQNITLKNIKELEAKGVEVCFVDDLNSKLVENKLKEKQVDVTVFTGGGLIRKNILDNAGAGVLNCHMGKLPEYRGMDVVEWPVFKKDLDNIGFTVHFMDKGVDTGDILKVFDVKLIENETIKSLRARFEPIMTQSFVETIIGFLKGEIERKPQAEEDGRQYYIIDKHLNEIGDQYLQQQTRSK